VAHPLEIGRSLREARVARGLGLETVEEHTKIRARYLAALEEERFGELPGEAYARGFLRAYADHLGLDGQEVIAAYRAREQPREEAPVAPRAQRPYEPARLGPAIAGALAALVLVVSSLVAWQLGDDAPTRAIHPPAAKRTRPATQQPAPAVLTISATAAGPLQVRLGGPQGRRVWTGKLRAGQRLRLGLRRSLWLRAGAPGRLRLVVAGETRRLPPGVSTAIVTRRGVRAA
jgi:hypothetical protein